MSVALPVSHTLNLPAQPACANVSGTARTPDALAGSMHSEDILRGHKAVEITHNGSTYRLQATRLGKLILTK